MLSYVLILDHFLKWILNAFIPTKMLSFSPHADSYSWLRNLSHMDKPSNYIQAAKVKGDNTTPPAQVTLKLSKKIFPWDQSEKA